MKRRRETQVITTIELAGNCMLLLGKVLKSFLFNAIMFILGFGVAYVYVVSMVHNTASQCNNYQYISQIENDVQQQRQLCRKIEAELRVFKIKSAHDADPLCDDRLTKRLVSDEIKKSHR